MYVLLYDSTYTEDNAPCCILDVGPKGLFYKWLPALSAVLRHPKPTYTDDDGREFTDLRDFIEYYTLRDNSSFQILARGHSVQNLINRYPEIFI